MRLLYVDYLYAYVWRAVYDKSELQHVRIGEEQSARARAFLPGRRLWPLSRDRYLRLEDERECRNGGRGKKKWNEKKK